MTAVIKRAGDERTPCRGCHVRGRPAVPFHQSQRGFYRKDKTLPLARQDDPLPTRLSQSVARFVTLAGPDKDVAALAIAPIRLSVSQGQRAGLFGVKMPRAMDAA